MKKLLVVLLAMALLCATAHADRAGAVLDYVQGELALTPETAERTSDGDALNLIVDGDRGFITWTDSARSMAYGLSGQAADMAAIYGQLIPLAAWDGCALYENDELALAYDPVGDPGATREAYAAAVAERFAPGDEPAGAPEKDYVLNTNTKRFHYPGCPSVNQMKQKNRQDYAGSRDDLIAQGYKPCGNCKP